MELMSGHGLLGFVLSWALVVTVAVVVFMVVVNALAWVVDVLRGDRE